MLPRAIMRAPLEKNCKSPLTRVFSTPPATTPDPVLELHAAHDDGALPQQDVLEALALDVALDPDTGGDERSVALGLHGPLDPRAVQRTRSALRHPEVVHGRCAYGSATHPLLSLAAGAKTAKASTVIAKKKLAESEVGMTLPLILPHMNPPFRGVDPPCGPTKIPACPPLINPLWEAHVRGPLESSNVTERYPQPTPAALLGPTSGCRRHPASVGCNRIR